MTVKNIIISETVKSNVLTGINLNTFKFRNYRIWTLTNGRIIEMSNLLNRRSAAGTDLAFKCWKKWNENKNSKCFFIAMCPRDSTIYCFSNSILNSIWFWCVRSSRGDKELIFDINISFSVVYGSNISVNNWCFGVFAPCRPRWDRSKLKVLLTKQKIISDACYVFKKYEKKTYSLTADTAYSNQKSRYFHLVGICICSRH